MCKDTIELNLKYLALEL